MYIVQLSINAHKLYITNLTNKPFFLHHHFPFLYRGDSNNIYIFTSVQNSFILLFFPFLYNNFCTFRHFTLETFMGYGFYSAFLSSCCSFFILHYDQMTSPRKNINKTLYGNNQTIYEEILIPNIPFKTATAFKKIIYLITNSCFVHNFSHILLSIRIKCNLKRKMPVYWQIFTRFYLDFNLILVKSTFNFTIFRINSNSVFLSISIEFFLIFFKLIFSLIEKF